MLKIPGRKSSETPSTPASTPNLARRPRSSKKLLGVFAAIAFLVLLVAWRRSHSTAVEHAEVTTAVAETGDVRATVSASGVLQAYTTVDVKSKAGGTVIKMAVEEGTRVKKGQLICLIDRQDTTAAYRQAQADELSSRAALRQAQDSVRLQNASIGPQISQSSAALESANAKLKQARISLSQETSTAGPQVQQSSEALNSARAKLQQSLESLELQRSTSQSGVEEAQSNVRAAQARLEEATETSRSQPSLSQAAIAQAQANLEASQASLTSSQETLKLLQASTQPQEAATASANVEQSKSDVEIAQTNLNRQQALLAKGFVAQNAVDVARNQLVAAQSGLRTSQARLDTLEAGQSTSVREQQARVAQAQSNVAQSRAALTSAQANTVQDVLKTKEVASARASLQQSQAALKTAQANRRQVALKQGDVAAAQAAVRQASAALTGTRAGTRSVAVKAEDVAASQAAVRQAAAALRGSQANILQTSVKGEDVAQAQAKLVRAQVTAQNALTNLQQTVVVAPRDGIVLKKYVDEGTIIQSGQSGFSGGTAIVQLANVSRMYVDTQVDEADIAQIAPGQNVSIALDAYPDAPREGKVRKIFPEAETTTNVTYVHVQVEVAAKDVDARLRPAMNATCDFLVKDKPQVLSVPSEAVRDVEKATMVTTIKDPHKPLWDKANQRERKVQVGVRGDERTEILSGLKAGDTVVVKSVEPVSASTQTSSGGGSGGGSGGSRRGGIGMMGPR